MKNYELFLKLNISGFISFIFKSVGKYNNNYLALLAIC